MKRNFEDALVKISVLYRDMPHIPATARGWIAGNIWWIALIGAIIGAIGVLSLVFITLLGGIFLAGAVFLFTAKFGGFALLLSVMLVAALIANAVVLIMAISPLKARLYKGWYLLAVSLALNLLAAVLTLILKQEIITFVWNIMWVGVGGYLLFEIQAFFQIGVRKPSHSIAPEYRPATQDDSTRS
jgi:hypothetical protein